MASESAQSYEQMENPLQYFEDIATGVANPMTHSTPAYAPYTSTAGYRDLGGSGPYMDPTLLKRPARKQVSNRTYFEDHASDGQDYNIWYHKRPGYRQDKFEERENPETRCNILTDAGKTKATKKSPFCIYFAHGRCSQGSDCQYHHRIPTFEDEDRHDLAHDIFGRERHATDKDDMSGVGNFTRECRSMFEKGVRGLKTKIYLALYVGCVKMRGDVEASIKRHFEEWGPIEYSRAIHTKSIAFIRFYLRASAEFAKEAMSNQSLDNNDVLMIRWATDDTNPIAKEYEEKRKHVVASDALNKRLKIMGAADQATMFYQITAAHSYEFAGYSTEHTNEQHPYASLAAARKAALEQNQAAGQTDPAATAAGYDGYNQSDPYAYYYQYAYAQHAGDGTGVGTETTAYSEFMPTYRTAAAALAEQEEEEEEEERRGVPPTKPETPHSVPAFGGSSAGDATTASATSVEGKDGGESDLQSFYATVYSDASSGNTAESPGRPSVKESAKEGVKAKGTKATAKSSTVKTGTKPSGGGQIKKGSTVKKTNKK